MTHPRVLVVEDEVDILDVLAHSLSREGYRVRSTRDGGNAVLISLTAMFSIPVGVAGAIHLEEYASRTLHPGPAGACPVRTASS